MNTSLEGALLSDGNWRLTAPGRSISGASCDLENTCFPDVPPGTLPALARMAWLYPIGFAITPGVVRGRRPPW